MTNSIRAIGRDSGAESGLPANTLPEQEQEEQQLGTAEQRGQQKKRVRLYQPTWQAKLGGKARRCCIYHVPSQHHLPLFPCSVQNCMITVILVRFSMLAQINSKRFLSTRKAAIHSDFQPQLALMKQPHLMKSYDGLSWQQGHICEKGSLFYCIRLSKKLLHFITNLSQCWMSEHIYTLT